MAVAWKERCRTFLEDEGGWDELVSLVRLKLSEPNVALGALKLMAEYAYGKPQQSVDLQTHGPLVKVIAGVDQGKACPRD